MNWNKLKLKKLLQSQAMTNELIKYIPHHSLTIHAAKPVQTELIPIKILINYGLITVFERKKRIEHNIYSPAVIKLQITQEVDYYTISIYYYNQEIVVFNWYDVSKIPILTDAIMEFLELDFQSAKQIYKQTETLIFHSKIKKKTHQIFKFRDNKTKFYLDFQDQIRTKVTFDWLLYRLQLENLKLSQKIEISFLDIQKINFILRRNPDYSTFDSLEITIEGKAFGLKQLINVETVFNKQYQPKSVFKVNPKLTFNSVQNVFFLLKTKVELAEIEIDFLVV